MTTNATKLLTSIWGGNTTLADADYCSHFQTLVGRFFPIRSIVLSVPEGSLSGRVFTDEIELLPALPLGDVIAEEFETDVPAGTIIICCSEAVLSRHCGVETRSKTFGRICAEIILDTVLMGLYRIEAEIDAIRHLAEAAMQAAIITHAETGEIEPSLFGMALSEHLDSYLLGHGAGEDDDASLVRHVRRLLTGGIEGQATLCNFDAGSDGHDMASWANSVATTLHVLSPRLKPEECTMGFKANSNSV